MTTRRGARAGPVPSAEDLGAMRAEAEALTLAQLRAVVARSERGGGWIDTKIDPRTGRDADATDPLSGPDAVYGWIQGRGLEALAGHANWIERHPAPAATDLPPRIDAVLDRALCALRPLLDAHGGRLPFLAHRDGRALRITPGGGAEPGTFDPQAPATLTDIFLAKGLLAAGQRRGEPRLRQEALRLFERIDRDLWRNAIWNDQQSLDPKNPVRPVSGRRSHAPWMLMLGARRLLLALTGEETHFAEGMRCLEHILARHVRTEPSADNLPPGAMWEFVGEAGGPWIADGVLWCDPGHATECAGLGFALLREAEGLGMAVPEPCRVRLGEMLRENFALGFAGKGIAKGVDWLSRRPLHDDMPWWSLPETMRAAALAAESASGAARSSFLAIYRQCHDALFRFYVLPGPARPCLPNLARDGTPSRAVPATPDPDPCYHTGLSLLDAMDALDRSAAVG